MSVLGQRTLIGYLVDPDALAVIAHEGMPEEAIPSEELRPVVRFALDYYFRSGLTKAPSEAVLQGRVRGSLTTPRWISPPSRTSNVRLHIAAAADRGEPTP